MERELERKPHVPSMSKKAQVLEAGKVVHVPGVREVVSAHGQVPGEAMPLNAYARSQGEQGGGTGSVSELRRRSCSSTCCMPARR